jgi:hypothetical protein
MLIDDEDRRAWVALLVAAKEAETANLAMDPIGLGDALDRSADGVRQLVDEISSAGLALFGEDDAEKPIVTAAGEEFVTAAGEVPREELTFLPMTIQNLLSRRALLHAGTVLVDEFRCALLEGKGPEHARQLVPPAFAAIVDERMSLNLYSAAVALMARLSADEPAGCVAEEIVAVALIEEAQTYLELRREEGVIGAADAERARVEIGGIFELFQDDDVLDMFEMAEPADAAVSGHDPFKQELGVVDQRPEAWFQPFSWTSPTGYLDDAN